MVFCPLAIISAQRGFSDNARMSLMATPEFWPCPRCGRRLISCGTVSIDGAEVPAFQCDRCTRTIDPFASGKGIEVALTLCVVNGRTFDPSDPGADLGPTGTGTRRGESTD